jgi:hypothetical protein
VSATNPFAAGLALFLALPVVAQQSRAREVPLQAPPPATAGATTRQAPLAADSAPGEITVTVITFSPGELVWERFGHNALWIHDGRAGTDIAWNWGLFDFAQPDFLQRFLSGDTRYWMAGEDAYRMIAAYHEVGRTITLQRLDLTQQQAAALRDFVRWNSLEENKYYRYDYFRDNCSTRLRDAIDRVLGGALKRATDSVQTPLTYRGESVRLTSGLLPEQLGIDVALGRPADRPISEWQSFFIPMRLRDGLRTVTVPRPGGTPVALVSDQRTIPPTSGPGVTVPNEPPSLVLRYCLLGVLLAAVAVVLRAIGKSNRAGLWALSLFGMLWSLLCGVIGLVLIYMWAFTRHVFWGWNENLLLLSPLSLALLILLPAALLRSRGVGPARAGARIVAVLGVLALFMSIVPGGQANLAIVALVLPLHLALAWALSLPLPEPVPRVDRK